MAEVFSNSPCTMLGKRVLSPAHHNAHASNSSQNQLDFGGGSSKKRQRFGGHDQQGLFDRYDSGGGAAAEHQSNRNARSSSPARAGKRARPLSYLQPSSSQLSSGGDGSGNGLFGPSHQLKHTDTTSVRDREQHELAALRREIGELRAHAAEKEGGLTLAQVENERLRDGVSMYQKEVERLTGENRILKRAVGIQNTKGKELESQLHNLQQAAGQAAEYMKRLEQTNYALSVRVQTMGNSGPSDFMGGMRPPDVY